MLMLGENRKFKLTIIYLILTIVAVDVDSQTPCRTQRMTLGMCVPIVTCETIRQLLESSPRPPAPSIVQFVQKAHCGTFDGVPHVCCERGRISEEQTSTTPRITTTTRRMASLRSLPKISPSVARSDTDIQSGMAILEASRCGINEAGRITAISVGNASEFSPHSVCRTQHVGLGVCIPVFDCKTITELLTTSPKPLAPSVVQFVQESHCGFYGNVHHVCCHRNRIARSVSLPTATTTEPKTTTAMLSDDDAGIWEEPLRYAVGNGLNADPAEYPWVALLKYDDGVESTLECGGSLITDRYVLTAAHCIRVQRKTLVSVRLGEHNTLGELGCTNNANTAICTQPVQEIGIEEAIYHKDYSPSRFSDDIGLIRLIRKAVFGATVQPICLPLRKINESESLDRLIIAGWGLTETGEKATILQKAFVPLKENDYCQNIHKIVTITDRHLCAGGEDNIDTCKGDSGGPIFSYAPYSKNSGFVQFGVVSAGSSRCGSNFPSIYVRVSSYLPWIAGNLKP